MTDGSTDQGAAAPAARQGVLGGGVTLLWGEAWPVVVLTAVLWLVFAGQLIGDRLGYEEAIYSLGSLFPPYLWAGFWWTPITHIFLHAGWLHIVMNSGALVALGPVIAQRLGRDMLGGALFLAFFLICGVAGAGAFLLLHPHDQTPMIGASGAICGLWGAGSRFTQGGQAALQPIFSRSVGKQAVSFAVMNLLVVGLGAAYGVASGVGIIGVAWEAHVGGFLAGLLLIPLTPVRFHWLRPAPAR